MRKFDIDAVAEQQEGEFERLPVGGYVAKITACEDVPEKEYLKIEYDVAEGKYKGYHAETYQRAKFWGGRFVRSYKEKAQGFFKAFITSVEQSNPNYTWDWRETGLIGKLLGVVIGEREYLSTKDGSVQVGLEVAQVRSVKAIREGDFKIPKRREMSDADRALAERAGASVEKPSATNGYTEVEDEELPF